MPDPRAVNSMFGRIARRYDLANLVLCGGIDSWWRRQLVRSVRTGNPRTVVDLATGSGDVAFALSRGLGIDATIVGLDFCAPMLEQAEARKMSSGPERYANVSFRTGDILDLPLSNASCDAVTIAFGVRNLADRAKGLREMRRILRPGGTVHVLEFSQPARWLRPLYYFYLGRILPGIAALVAGDREAYVYLNETIADFPGREALEAEVAAAGFGNVRSRALTGGIVALHEGRR